MNGEVFPLRCYPSPLYQTLFIDSCRERKEDTRASNRRLSRTVGQPYRRDRQRSVGEVTNLGLRTYIVRRDLQARKATRLITGEGLAHRKRRVITCLKAWKL